MHPRNRNATGYDFAALCASSAGLAKYLKTTPAGTPGIDFANPAAVKALNRALLIHHYGVHGWDIPAGYLCPPIPGRADYLHALADLLAEEYDGVFPVGPQLRAVDIGTGANLVYPLLGRAEYGWSFLGTDIDEAALANAARILGKNPAAATGIELRRQPQADKIFDGLLRSGETFTLAMCNPPFHGSPGEAASANRRKWNQLGKPGAKGQLNFGGGDLELWCPGGERLFVQTMIEQSARIPKRVLWFPTLLSKADNLPAVQAALQRAHAIDTKVLPMAQGQKQSRIVAWTFCPRRIRRAWLRDLVAGNPVEPAGGVKI